MLWIKRNLVFVVAGAVALALMGFAVFLLLSNISENTQIQEQINQRAADLQRLYGSNPFPSDENIEAIKREQQRVKAVLVEARKGFAPFPPVPKMDDRGFKSLLLSNIQNLRTKAANASVALPPGYEFSFAAQTQPLKFAAGSVGPWLSQLGEINAICNILFDAKILGLDAIQRVPVSPDDAAGSADYFAGVITTNQLGVFSPYRITFRCFSGELERVLEGFVKSTNCFVVKSVSIDPASVQAADVQYQDQPVVRNTGQVFRPQFNRTPAVEPGFDDRYGTRAPVTRRPPPVAVAPGATTSRQGGTAAAAVTVLSESQLRVSLQVDAVKLNPAK